MYAGRDFSPSDVGENEVYSFDMINDLPDGDVINTGEMTLTVTEGDDDDPDSHLIGSAVLSDDTTISQRITGLVAGCLYCLTATAVTAAGNTISLWSHIDCRDPA